MLIWDRSGSSILLMGGESRSCPRAMSCGDDSVCPLGHPETWLDGEIDSLMGLMVGDDFSWAGLSSEGGELSRMGCFVLGIQWFARFGLFARGRW